MILNELGSVASELEPIVIILTSSGLTHLSLLGLGQARTGLDRPGRMRTGLDRDKRTGPDKDPV